MGKTAKVLLGIATVWPLIYVFIFFAFVFSSAILAMNGSAVIGDPSSGFGTIFILHMFTILLMFVLLAIYIVNVFNNDHVENDKKALWAVVLFLGNLIAMPIYWYLYIWRDTPGTEAE